MAQPKIAGECAVCGKFLVSARTDIVYCSHKCQMRAFRAKPPTACAVCGAFLGAKRADVRYCGPTCRKRAQRQRGTETRAVRQQDVNVSSGFGVGSCVVPVGQTVTLDQWRAQQHETT